ncbi:unnamed protein product [Lactuca virosa]|uniref:DNA 3'-5' helicase n=1 Tax=Lactuca virosa TaxID=75947 RepID=A0AAU9LNW0_9ASTR|nr:unnamed protein product [Lactuca virosa]
MFVGLPNIVRVTKELRERGVSANHYHADMDVNAREKVHMRWSNSRLQVAFGMGINKPDVRFVIHHNLGKSMETYYQESGRVGTDGLPSECLLYFRPADVPRQKEEFSHTTYATNAYMAIGPLAKHVLHELDNLRKELASMDGGIFTHSILSTQQIGMLCSQKPETTEQVTGKGMESAIPLFDGTEWN